MEKALTKRAVLKIAVENGINTELLNVYRRGGELQIEMREFPKELLDANMKHWQEMERVNGYGENLPQIGRLTRRYNRAAYRLTRTLKKVYGVDFCEFERAGAVRYREGDYTNEEILVMQNID